MSKKAKSDAATEAAAILGDTAALDEKGPVASEVKLPDAGTTAEAPESRPVPAELLEQLDEVQRLYDNVAKQIEDFKSGQAYLPGDIPVTLHGLSGPGFESGIKRLNFIDDKHLDSRLAFRWCNKRTEIVGRHIGRGRWGVKWVDFEKMVLARGGKRAVEAYRLRFATSPEGYVALGDQILMATTKEQNEALKAQVRRKTDNLQGSAKGTLYEQCEKLGTEPIEGETSGPKLQRLLTLLEKELGPQVRRVFLGR